MNTRIKELYKQAYGVRLSTDDFALEQNEKMFAELIIRECLQVVEDQRDPSTLNYSPKARTAEQIKYHFGL